MSSIRIDTAQVAETAEQLRAASALLAGDLSRLEGQVAAVIAAWSGDAQEAYAAAQLDWNQSLERLRVLLGAIADAASDTAEMFDLGDDAVAGRFA